MKSNSGNQTGQTHQIASPELNENTTRKRTRTSSPSSILGRLRIAVDKKNADEMISLVPIMIEKGMLLDMEVAKIFEYRISFFTSNQLAELTNAWPDQKNTRYSYQYDVIAEIIAGRNNPEQYFSLLSKISPEKASRGDMIMTMVQKMSMFSAEELGTHLERFGSADLPFVAEGLVARAENNTTIKSKKIELTSRYIETVTDIELLGPLVKFHLSLSAPDDPLEALKWANKQDPEVVIMCDKPLIEALIKNYPAEATNYVNTILSGNDRGRADKALEYMVSSYSKIDPQGALTWVLSLPKDAQPTDQMYVTSFVRLKDADPQRAKEILDTIKDLKLKRLLERVSL